MNPDIRAEWVRRLRSGDYKQGTSRLSYLNGYFNGESEVLHCCWGVLCDMAVEAGAVERRLNDFKEMEYRNLDRSSFWHEGMPTGGVFAWAGFEKTSLEGTRYAGLAGLNDSGTPFTEIADIIEHADDPQPPEVTNGGYRS